MKIRNGFVSNSSSSSFCIYGTALEFGEVLEKLNESKYFTEEELENFDEDEGIYEIGEIISKKTTLSVHVDGEGDTLWVGKEWSTIGDDETGREFKESIKTELEKLLGVDVDCDTYDETIYN